MTPPDAADTFLARHEPELISLRRRLHAHPELGHQEHATTDLLYDRLAAEGLKPQLLPSGSGLWCDVGCGPGPTVMVRADLDALPLGDETATAYRSTVAGVCHACGHDVHTAVVLGTGLALAAADERSPLPGTVRLVFQPAEELMPGGALDMIAAGVLAPVSTALAVHCDPAVDVGYVGLWAGPITAAADRVIVTLEGPGGHTSRPQNTVDLVYALARLVVELPAAMSRLVDPRAAMSLVWGQIQAGTAPNAIPRSGVARGTLRMLSRDSWDDAPGLVRRLAEQIAGPYGATVDVDYRRGIPPVVNSSAVTQLLRTAAERALGPAAVLTTGQSLGGEDFAWYLEHVPGAMARLGTRTPGGATYDLHQGRFDVDERAIGVGVRLLTHAALEALEAR
ncbi:MAG TPA: amidohydrolase [Frankiaceae bacterium]|nr:amidohydrolase [Frankiaceae bacterium]